MEIPNYYGLQVQIQRLQEFRGEQRTALLMEMRKASLKGNLRLAAVDEGITSLVTAIRNEHRQVISIIFQICSDLLMQCMYMYTYIATCSGRLNAI